MLGIVVRELTYLKILAPIMQQLHNSGVNYNLYHFDAPRGDKEYNRATLSKLEKAHKKSIDCATRIKAFSDDKQLIKHLVSDKITKLVSIEIWLWAKDYLKELEKNSIKTYSILYLTDSLWQKDQSCITSMHKVYYSTKYLMKTYHEFSNTKFDPSRDKCLGSPIFDSITCGPSKGKDILVLLPNLRKEHVGVSFGSAQSFVDIIAKLAEGGDLIFKTRKKQWLPNEIKKYAKEIIDDGDVIHPPVVVDLLKRCYCTVMFYSSGVYEAVYGGNYIVNIPIPLKRWGWDQDKMKSYFSRDEGSIYMFDGVVESIDQNAISDDWEFVPKRIDASKQKEWVNKYIGTTSDAAKKIVESIINE